MRGNIMELGITFWTIAALLEIMWTKDLHPSTVILLPDILLQVGSIVPPVNFGCTEEVKEELPTAIFGY
jgi:hypothetical protein